MMSAEHSNVITLRDILARGFTAREIRFMLLTVHYRKPIQFSFKRLENVRTALRRLDEFTCKLFCLPSGKPHPEVATFVSSMQEQFFEAMDDDLNVSKGMSAIYRFIKKMNPILQVNHLDRDQKDYILESLAKMNQVLQVFRLQGCPLIPEANTLIELREKARTEKKAKKTRKNVYAYGLRREYGVAGVSTICCLNFFMIFLWCSSWSSPTGRPGKSVM